jgi:UDP-N-acetylglucosamine--N-acetylmuramyl-(pentapeptide) pyrophosphoryl-undecaprenol N-acetylglucosamine transferase
MLAAGGTGGHMFPAEALARELLKRGVNVCLMTDVRGGQFSADLLDVPVYRIHAAGLGRSLAGKIRGAAQMLWGTVQAWGKIRALKPSLVVGFGGYSSVPTVFAASRCQIPVMLHEQNAVVGRANKIMAPLARVIATSFSTVRGLEKANVHKVLTGNPVRPSICALNELPYPELGETTPLNILVMGGSLGAHIFSDVVPKAVKLLPEPLRKRLNISQQCRKDDLDAVRHAYGENGVHVELATFFHDVPERLAACHLAICRSGASTVSELTVAGRPAILVPYPHAITGEQKANAEALAEAGSAWLIPQQAFTPEALAVRLESILTLPSTLNKAAIAAKGLARVSAASKLADLALDVIGLSQDGLKKGYNEGETNQTIAA